MAFEIFVYNAYAGEARHVATSSTWDQETEFYWTEGNAGCDCNRHLYYERARGVEPTSDVSCEGDIFQLFVLCDGVIVYDERSATEIA